MTGGGEVEAARRLVGKFREHDLEQLTAKAQLGGVEAHHGQFEDRVGKKHIIVEVGVESRIAAGAGGEQPAVAPMVPTQKGERRGGRMHQIGAIEEQRRRRQAAYCQRIPAREYLLVALGAGARGAQLQEFRACTREERRHAGRTAFAAGGQRVEAGGDDQMMRMAFEIRWQIEAMTRSKHGVLIGTQRLPHGRGFPDVIAAFDTGGIGIEAGIEGAVRRAQFGEHPVGGAMGYLSEQQLARGGGGLGVGAEQQGVVVEHLLEMRNGPVPIDAVTVEATAQLVEQAALGHARQRQRRHVQGVQVRRLIGGARVPVAQRALHQRRVRKFRRGSEAAPFAIEAALELCAAALERGGVERHRARCRRRLQLAQGVDYGAGLLAQFGFMVAVVVGDVGQKLAERGHAVARNRRKIGAAEERPLVVVHQEHGQRPAAAAPGQHLVRQLVDAIEVRAFLAIDLDVHEARVHECGGRRILEGLVRHDVTPVAGRVADR